MGTTDKQYHIEGLRGIAIIFVILFHFFPKWFPMGYLGVDIFLVISGYLLFVRPIRRGDNGVLAASWSFIKRKTGRLMPPLAATFLFSFAVSFFVLTPEELPGMIKTSFYALLGGSNFYLDSIKNDYFAADTYFNPMVPTWYLSLTCQIYLLFLLGWLILPRKGLKAILLILLVLSVTYANIRIVGKTWANLTGTPMHLDRPSYYSIWPRIWEIIAGGIVILLPGIRSKRWGNVAGIVSVALLFLFFFWYRKQMNTAIAFMVAASVLSMRYAGAGWAKRFLTNPVLLWLGKMSFAIYLVHMTVAVALNSLVDEPGVWSYAAAFSLVFACGALFHHLVERRKFGKIAAFAVWGVALAVSWSFYSSSPINAFLWKESNYGNKQYKDWAPMKGTYLDKRFDAKILKPDKFTVSSPNIREYKTPFYKLGTRSQDKVSFVLLGDSHAGSLLFGIDAACRKHGITGAFVSVYVLPFHDWEFSSQPGLWSTRKEKALLQWLGEHPEIRTVIIGQRWSIRAGNNGEGKGGLTPAPGSQVQNAGDSIRLFVKMLRGLGKSVIIAAPVPEIESTIPAHQYRRYRQYHHEGRRQSLVCPFDKYKSDMAFYLNLLHKMEKEGLCHVLPIADSLFHDGVFYACEGGKLLMTDSNHLSPSGSEKAVLPCTDQLAKWLEEAAATTGK